MREAIDAVKIVNFLLSLGGPQTRMDPLFPPRGARVFLEVHLQGHAIGTLGLAAFALHSYSEAPPKVDSLTDC